MGATGKITGSTEELLAMLIELSGPCPNICDGTTPLGGPTGTAVINILTGQPVTPYPPINFPPEIYLELTFNDINNTPVGDPSIVSDWNTLFDLPTNGNPFTSVEVIGNTVRLFGGSDIVMKDNLFDGYNSLLSVDDGGCVIELQYNVFGNDSTMGSTNLVSVNFPNVVTVGNSSFYQCTSLSSINMPKVTYINSYTFQQCTSLTSINLPLLTATGDYCFDGCTSLVSAILPNIITLGQNSFASCDSLGTVDFPLATTAGSTCFDSCISLTSVDLPSLTGAGSYCFSYCTILDTFNLPSLTTAGSSCFAGLNALTTISLPSLTTASDSLFDFCTSLTTISLPLCTDLGGTTGDDSVFNAISGNTITLTVPTVLATCDSGNPDGDIVYLDNNNTVTINYV